MIFVSEEKKEEKREKKGGSEKRTEARGCYALDEISNVYFG